MRFVHTSDWHLGFRQYNIETRFEDFSKAAGRTVKRIIELKPDFVLHTGDLFHDNRPTSGSIRVAVALLLKLKRAGIPVYMIRGNHDTSENVKGGSIMHLLHDLELIEFVNNTVHSFEDIDIVGVNYHPIKTLERTLDKLISNNRELIRSKERFTILALHNFVQGQLDHHEIPLTRLSDLGFDYIGVGHYHIPWSNERFNIYTPGSTEATSSNDWKRDDAEDEISIYSSFLLVESNYKAGVWGKAEVTTVRVPVRPKIWGTIESQVSNLEGLENEIKEFLSKKLELLDKMTADIKEYKEKEDRDPLLNLRVSTRVDPTDLSALDRRSLVDRFLQPAKLEITSESVVELPDISNSGDVIARTMRELIEEEVDEEERSEFTLFIEEVMSEYMEIPKSRYNKIQQETVDELVDRALALRVEEES